jgi:hypothetical protein
MSNPEGVGMWTVVRLMSVIDAPSYAFA